MQKIHGARGIVAVGVGAGAVERMPGGCVRSGARSGEGGIMTWEGGLAALENLSEETLAKVRFFFVCVCVGVFVFLCVCVCVCVCVFGVCCVCVFV